MRDVSNAYKQAVYNRGEYELYARHFLPYAMLKIIDMAAMGHGIYSTNDSSFYSRLSELADEIDTTTRLWGTLEDHQFLLSSSAVLMPDEAAVIADAAQQGWVTEQLSDAAGLFSGVQPQLICRYRTQVSTVGRTMIFNNMYDAVPRKLRLDYYRSGALLATEEITRGVAVGTLTVPRGRMRGDVNGNGIIDANVAGSDSTLALEASVGGTVLDPIQTWCADVDGSSRITATDALFIMQRASGKYDIYVNADYYGNWVWRAASHDWECSIETELPPSVYLDMPVGFSYERIYNGVKIIAVNPPIEAFDVQVIDTSSASTSPIFVSQTAVSRYDEVHLTILATTLPFRRVHLLEDLPGVILEYAGEDIVSITLNQQVDLFSEQLIDGEIELAVQNVTKQLDILNAQGLEKYLQRRQPLTTKLNLVFPDDSVESVLLGNWDLTSWKSNKGALEATFTISDPINRLTGIQYIKGTVPIGIKSLYDYAVDVFEDAGFSNYIIDVELHNIYSKACLPIAEHKELLRMIAQAGQAVVVPTADGALHIRSMSPLIYAYNTVMNGAFNDVDGEVSNWEITNATVTQDYLFAGTNSILLGYDANIKQSVELSADHKYYCRVYVLCTEDVQTKTGEAYYKVGGVARTVNIRSANLVPEDWVPISGLFVGDAGEQLVELTSTVPADLLYIDGMMLLDLTTIYGAGTEPSQEWCDENIPYVSLAKAIPRAIEPAPQDNLDYRVLIDAPEVELSEPVKSIETSIYSYVPDMSASEVYKGARVVAGTETFTIKYSSLASNVSIQIFKLDDAGEIIEDVTEEALIEAEIYNRAAELTVRAAYTVQIVATGTRLTTSKATYKLTSNLDHKLLDDAVEKIIDNELITYQSVAEDVTSYAAFWYGRRYLFDFDWRQNPAVEVLDIVTVHDDFSNDKGVLLTERDIEYANGILTGNAKGVAG